MPVIFVHGVTVREQRFKKLLETVRKEITARRPELKVEGFYWGDRGSSLQYQGASIPSSLAGTQAIDLPIERGGSKLEQDQLKALLLDEPYLELIALKDIEEFNPAGSGFTPLPINVEARNRNLSISQSRVITDFQNNHLLSSAIGKKVANNTINQIVQHAFEHAGRTNRRYTISDLIAPLVRCLTATLYQAIVGNTASLDTEFAWSEAEKQIQNTLERELGGQRSWLTDNLKNVALNSATAALRHGWRRRIMQATSLFIGDVFVYFSKKDSFSQDLDEVVAKATKLDHSPLWLVGHSLGGVICYDYCCQTSRNVERLVTIGSQVGLFSELGVLKNPAGLTEAADLLPGQIGHWLNIYDPDDMLSFLAQPIFSRAVDVEVDTTAPFPVSHGSIFESSEGVRNTDGATVISPWRCSRMSATDFAIVIGISRYPLLKDLDGPVEDAKQFQEWLLTVAHVPRSQIKLIVSKKSPHRGDRPIADEIDDAFREVFNAAHNLQLSAKPIRRLYLYFAGHGCSYEFRHVALLMANASLDDLNRSLNAERYHEGLARRALFPEQIIFYDCCRNWDHRVMGRIPSWSRDDPDSGAATVIQFVLYAAGFTEYANERLLIGDPHGIRQGYFTTALLEGLNGRAVKKENGEWIVSTETLVPYVRRRLDELTVDLGIRQHLCWNPAGLPKDLILAKIVNPGLYSITVSTQFSGTDIIFDDDSLAEFQRSSLLEGQASFYIPPGLYRVRVEPGGPEKLVVVGPGKPCSISL